MTGLIIDLIQNWITSMGTTLTDFIKDLYYFVFFIEEQFQDITTSGGSHYFIDFNAVYRTIYAWGLIFLIIVFIKKMIQTYFLFKTGEEDQSPVRVVIGLIEAVIIDITFGWIYVFIVKMGYNFYLSLNASAGFNFDKNFMNDLATSAEWGLFTAVCIFIITCEFIGLIWNMIKRGLQILILRLVIPITTIGLLDANGGSFAVVAKKLIQSIFSVIIQLLLMSFSIMLISKKRYIYAVATMGMTIEGPEFLRDFLVGAGGLGVAQMASKGVSFMHHANPARAIGTATGTVKNLASGISAGFNNGLKSAGTAQIAQGENLIAQGHKFKGVANKIAGSAKEFAGGNILGRAAMGVVGGVTNLGRQAFTNDRNQIIQQSTRNMFKVPNKPNGEPSTQNNIAKPSIPTPPNSSQSKNNE